jgi:membrane protein DedA with SNARE-associated domain
MEAWFIQLATGHVYFLYFAIIAFASIVGPILAIIFGWLVHTGSVDFWPIYFALMIGDLVGDTVWYSVGAFAGHPFIRRFGKYLSITEEKVSKITLVFHKHKDSILIISKITNGFGFAIVTLVTAGIVKIPFKRYIAFNVMGQLVWTGILMTVGYFFGSLYSDIGGWFGKLSVIFGIVILLSVFYGFGKYIRTRTIKNYPE